MNSHTTTPLDGKTLEFLADVQRSKADAKLARETMQGAKYDAGKPDLTLLEGMADALGLVAKVLEFGAKKYSRDSWQSVPDGMRRYKAAAMRHALQPLGKVDEESGLLHAAHEACSILFAIQLRIQNQHKEIN